MKRIFLLFLFLSISAGVWAQSTTHPRPVLAAYTNTISNGSVYVPTDSGILNYDSGFSYNAKTATYEFDTTFGYKYSSSTGYTTSSLQVETYDAHKNVVYDLVFKYDVSGLWIDSQKMSYQYDANDIVISSAKQVYNPATKTWKNIEKHLYTNDIAKDRIVDIYQQWNSAASNWNFVTEHDYTYNSKHTMLSDTSKAWVSLPMKGTVWGYTGLKEYIYDTAERITMYKVDGATYVSAASIWTFPAVYRYEYEYDASTKDLVDKLHEQPVPSSIGWIIDSTIYYTFDTSHNLVYEENPHYFENTFTYDTAHNLLSATYIVWGVGGPFVPSRRYFYSYNPTNQITIYTSEIYNNPTGKWVGQLQNRYYYKIPPPTKVPPAAVSTVEANTASVRVYPCPATNILNIDIRLAKEQPAVIAIYDMSGKLYAQWQTEAALFSHSNIPVDQLPNGNYILQIRSEKTQVNEKFSVIH